MFVNQFTKDLQLEQSARARSRSIRSSRFNAAVRTPVCIIHADFVSTTTIAGGKWCPGAESNHRHCDFQSRVPLLSKSLTFRRFSCVRAGILIISRISVDVLRHWTHTGRHSSELIVRTQCGHDMKPGSLSEDTIKRLQAPAWGNSITYFAGATVQGAKAPRGFGVRVTASGARAFILNYRLRGREHRFTIGAWPDWTALRAVREARNLRQRVDRGEDPLKGRAPILATKSVSNVIDDFMTRYVRNKERPLRSADQIQSAFDRLVKPRIGKIGVYELRRSHVAEMLDRVEDEAGPVQADRVRAYLRKALSWYAERDDEFNLNAAFVRVVARANPKERARTRVLSDDELRIVWPLLSEAGTFGALLKTLLLTAQRRDEAANMTWMEIGTDGTWTIPAERYKTKRSNHVPLSTAALGVIEAQPKIDGCDYVFPSRTKTPFSGFGKSKAKLDKAILIDMRKRANKGAEIDPLPNWTLHDLRRTAKTLMARAGVRPDISERVLGHVIAGVEGTYDRHSYADEKRDALEKLAAMIERILNPLPANVEKLGEHRARVQS
jgi:integrase